MDGSKKRMRDISVCHDVGTKMSNTDKEDSLITVAILCKFLLGKILMSCKQLVSISSNSCLYTITDSDKILVVAVYKILLVKCFPVLQF